MRLRVRVLPLTIFAASLLLTAKIGAVWQGLDAVLGSVSVAGLHAQQTPGAPPTEQPAQTGGTAEEGANTAAGADSGAGEGEAASDEPEESLLEAESVELTPSELEVLQSLRERRRELDARASELDLRDNMLKAAEHALESRIEDWKQLKAKVEAMLVEESEQRENDLKTLATYYEKMKPKDAARVFNTLEMPYLIDIVQRMKDAKVADIIGKMDTGAARALTVEIAKRRQIAPPEDTPLVQN